MKTNLMKKSRMKQNIFDFPHAKSLVVSGNLYAYLYSKRHPLHYWFYGHFHQSWHCEINGVQYNMLDCMELREVRP